MRPNLEAVRFVRAQQRRAIPIHEPETMDGALEAAVRAGHADHEEHLATMNWDWYGFEGRA
jgi:hypothetical protein